MGSHPINLGLRFLLELAALFAMGSWGWRSGEGWVRFALALTIPVIAALAWGTFAVPDDPSRSGAAPVAVPGLIRLALEAAVFIGASWALKDLGWSRTSAVFGAIVIIHYLVSYDRVLWLVRR